MKRVCVCVAIAAGLGLGPAPAGAAEGQTAAPAAAVGGQAAEIRQVRDELARLKREFEQMRQQYDSRLVQLERQLEQLGGGGGPHVPPAGVAAARPAPASLPGTGAAGAALPAPQVPTAGQGLPAGSSKVFNPDASVIANFLGTAGTHPATEDPPLELSEAEVAFQAVVDPYARADFFLSASPEGLEIEEGYVTFTTLPANLLLKVGKMRAQFGKVNTLHTHTLPTADRPLVTENLVGGEEGLSDSGMSLSHLVANPLLFLEVTGEVYHGTSDVFQSSRRSELTYVGRLRAYHDLSESSNIDVGTSVAFGPTDLAGSLQTPGAEPDAPVLNKRLIGFDATFRYRPLRRAIYHRLNLRTELVWSRQDLPAAAHTSAFGFYGLAEYQFARRWYIGGRIDRSGRVLDGTLHDKGGSVFLTYWPSEFSQIRGQLRRTTFAEGVTANEFLFQFNFAIGAHGAHVF